MNTIAAWFLDAAIAGEDVPDSAALLGLAFVVAAAITLTWLATRAAYRRDVDDVEAPAGDPSRPIPQFVDERMAHERRRPSPRSRPRVVPAHTQVSVPVGRPDSEATTVVLRRDPDATAVIPAHRGQP